MQSRDSTAPCMGGFFMEFPLLSKTADNFAIALIVMTICIVCTVGSAAVQPPKPVIQKPVPHIVKLQDRLKKGNT